MVISIIAQTIEFGKLSMAIYRITQRQTALRAEAATTETQKRWDELGDYSDKVLRLIPGDVVAGYLTIRGFWAPTSQIESVSSDPVAYSVLQFWLPIAGLIATVALRIIGTPNKFWDFSQVQWLTVLVATVAYCLWILTIEKQVLGINIDARISASFLVLFTIAAPRIQPGTAQ